MVNQSTNKSWDPTISCDVCRDVYFQPTKLSGTWRCGNKKSDNYDKGISLDGYCDAWENRNIEGKYRDRISIVLTS